MRSVYLAGPEVFLPDAVEVGRRKQQLCTAYGFVGLYPLDNDIAAGEGGRVDQLIYDANKALMERADFGICNLTPFRGPGADAGTVFELGLMVGLGKPVFAYSNDAADYVHRVEAFAPGSRTKLRDGHELEVENFGNFDNLMLEWSVRESSGHPVVRHAAAAAAADLYRDLAGFEQCLRLAAASLTSAEPMRR
jgi:nucleoside 2-deoxyribosyltransferase